MLKELNGEFRITKKLEGDRTLLERARQALPNPTADVEEEFRNIMDQYTEMLAHNELGLAFDALEELGDLVTPPIEFWRDLERAAEKMSLTS